MSREQTPPAILAALGPVAGRPDALRGATAVVTEVAAYRQALVPERAHAEVAFGQRADLLAFANPTSAGALVDATRALALDLERCLGRVPVAAVGPNTARAATLRRLEPDFVAGGRLVDLARAIEDLAGGENRPA